MKVLHVINHIGRKSGAAKLLIDLVDYQLNLGYKVDVVSLVNCEPSYASILENRGLICFTFWNKQINRYNPFSIFRLIPLIRKYDIVHVHLFPSLYWVALAKFLSFSSCKLIYTEHSTLNNRQGKLWLYPLECCIYNQYDKLIAISEAVAIYLYKLTYDRRKVEVIYNGIDVNKYHDSKKFPASYFSLPMNKKYVVQVSRFAVEKDQMTLIRALKFLPDNYDVVLVGNGELLLQHKQRVKELGLDNRVHFLGLRDDVPLILKMADIVVLSSNFEGFGLAAVEGMAAGKPVIASDVPGLAEVVSGAGLLFKLHDEHELVAHILKLSEDKEYYEEMSQRCFMRAKEFDVSIMNARYEELYKSLLIEGH